MRQWLEQANVLQRTCGLSIILCSILPAASPLKSKHNFQLGHKCPLLWNQSLCALYLFIFLPPVTYFYSEIIVTVIFFYHVCLLIPEARPEGGVLAIAQHFACPCLQLATFHQTAEYF